MWKAYDTLIGSLPDDIEVTDVHSGPVWTIVQAGELCGIAVTVNEQNAPLPERKRFIGQSLKDVASLCRSWDFPLASIGTAALNAYINSPEQIRKTFGTYDENSKKNTGIMIHTGNTFDDYSRAVSGKKVAVIGHFTALERVLKSAENLIVLERKPDKGDLPDTACEYVLPYQDFVFITGSAFINKTLFRLLEISRNARTVVLGPSTPMAPVLFGYGADELGGLITENIPPEKFSEIGKDTFRLSSIGERIRLVK
ncbi:MAG TPA: DUF364 domain-containing protein [Bacillota bacterium]|nr:DUF364 domain-containing protein [Bacillota bacterium]HUM55525.1 DUF364 domain-containing protein [Bacillota bacterium]